MNDSSVLNEYRTLHFQVVTQRLLFD